MLTVGDFSGAGKILDRDSALPNINQTFIKRGNLGANVPARPALGVPRLLLSGISLCRIYFLFFLYSSLYLPTKRVNAVKIIFS